MEECSREAQLVVVGYAAVCCHFVHIMSCVEYTVLYGLVHHMVASGMIELTMLILEPHVVTFYCTVMTQHAIVHRCPGSFLLPVISLLSTALSVQCSSLYTNLSRLTYTSPPSMMALLIHPGNSLSSHYLTFTNHDTQRIHQTSPLSLPFAAAREYWARTLFCLTRTW